jgi:heat shock protein HtpX
MWEQIQSNKRRSAVLVVAMLLLLMALGFVIGEAAARGAGVLGLGLAIIVWIVMSLVAYYQGDHIFLAIHGARRITHDDHPQLFNIVEEMQIAAGLPKTPDVYIMNDMALNAFATGRSPDKAAVAVTAGLLQHLNRDQLQGVIAHEFSHIVNRDVLYMSMVGIMVGAIVMISEIFLRGLWYSGGARSRRYSSSSKGGGQVQAIMMVVAIVLAILAPLLAYLIYFAVSRRREYLADSNAALLTRYPEGLASALEVLAGDTHVLVGANKATAPMYIINPLHKPGQMALNLTGTHPPIQERIRILRGIGGNVSYAQYQSSWRQVSGKSAGMLPASALRAATTAQIREPHPQALAAQDARQQFRDAGDLMRKVNQFVFLPCVCGLRIKLPPDFKKDRVECPRCHRELSVPVAEVAAAGQVAAELPPGLVPDLPAAQPVSQEPPLQITHTGGWMTIRCSCGRTINLAPSCEAHQIDCRNCGRTIDINYANA